MNNYKKIAFLFPGQGVQYIGMARDFIDNFVEARRLFEQANDILKRDLTKIVLKGPKDLLTETRNCQPGIYVACLAMLKVLNSQYPQIRPSVCSGFSLGEFTALTAAEKIDFEQGLRLVENRGRLMAEACEKTKGTMVVVVGLDGDQVERYVADLNLPHDLWVADFTCPGQVVISGTLKGIEIGSAALKQKGARLIIPMPVHGAFHSGLMLSAEDQLKEYLLNIQFKESHIEIVMNVTNDFANSSEEIRQNLMKQVTSPVRWEQSIRKMGSNGVDLFVEIGCGKSLTHFNQNIGLPIPTINIENLKDLQKLS